VGDVGRGSTEWESFNRSNDGQSSTFVFGGSIMEEAHSLCERSFGKGAEVLEWSNQISSSKYLCTCIVKYSPSSYQLRLLLLSR